MIVEETNNKKSKQKYLRENLHNDTVCQIQIQLGGKKIKNRTQAEYLGWVEDLGSSRVTGFQHEFSLPPRLYSLYFRMRQESGSVIWRRKQQPTSVFLPGESQGQRSLADYSPWGCKSWTWLSDLNHHHQEKINILVERRSLKYSDQAGD